MACGSGESAPHILHLDSRQKWWLSSPKEGAHSIQRLNGPQNWSGCFRLKQDAPASNQTQIMWCPAHSLATSLCKINVCKINKESKNTCQTTKLSSLPPPLSGNSLQGIYRPLAYTCSIFFKCSCFSQHIPVVVWMSMFITYAPFMKGEISETTQIQN